MVSALSCNSKLMEENNLSNNDSFTNIQSSCLRKTSPKRNLLITYQNMSTPTSQQCFKTFFFHVNLDWKLIYLLLRILTKNTSLRAFQCKVLNSVLYIDSKL